MSDKDTKEILRSVRDAGWEVKYDGSNHARLIPPDGKGPLTIATTPSDVRATKNTRAQLRRMGLDISTGETVELECEHSWHEEGKPGRQCPRCRGAWRTVPVPAPKGDDDPQTIIDRAVDILAVQDEMARNRIDPDVPIEDRLRELFASLHEDTFLSTGEIHERLGDPSLDKETLRQGLRELFTEGSITRTRRGRYGRATADPDQPIRATVVQKPVVPEPEAPNHPPTPTVPEYFKSLEPAVDFEMSAPPDTKRPWMWDPEKGWLEIPARTDGPPLFEFLSTDSKGRLILKDEHGDLFCAVPLAPQF